MSKKEKRFVDRIFQISLGVVLLAFGTWVTVTDMIHDNTHMLIIAPIIATLWFCPRVCRHVSIIEFIEALKNDWEENWK